jgi:hypothetical protein
MRQVFQTSRTGNITIQINQMNKRINQKNNSLTSSANEVSAVDWVSVHERYIADQTTPPYILIMLLPGFQKGRDIKAS